MEQEKITLSHCGSQFRYPASWTVLRVAEATVDGVKEGYEKIEQRKPHLRRRQHQSRIDESVQEIIREVMSTWMAGVGTGGTPSCHQ